jgi:hypothetical protein
MTLRLIIISSLVIITVTRPARAQEAASGAAASDPTAAVNYQDVRYRYFDLDQGADKHSFETEGAYMLHPRFKITNELRYVNTDRSSKSVQDFEELKLKGIHLTAIEPFGIKAKLALGVEWLKDLGDFDKGRVPGRILLLPWQALAGCPMTETSLSPWCSIFIPTIPTVRGKKMFVRQRRV